MKPPTPIGTYAIARTRFAISWPFYFWISTLIDNSFKRLICHDLQWLYYFPLFKYSKWEITSLWLLFWDNDLNLHFTKYEQSCRYLSLKNTIFCKFGDKLWKNHLPLYRISSLTGYLIGIIICLQIEKGTWYLVQGDSICSYIHLGI